jgi:hypothetical protein
MYSPRMGLRTERCRGHFMSARTPERRNFICNGIYAPMRNVDCMRDVSSMRVFAHRATGRHKVAPTASAMLLLATMRNVNCIRNVSSVRVFAHGATGRHKGPLHHPELNINAS